MLRGTSHARRSVRPQRCLPTVDLVFPRGVPVLRFVLHSSPPRSPSAVRHSFAALPSDARPPSPAPSHHSVRRRQHRNAAPLSLRYTTCAGSVRFAPRSSAPCSLRVPPFRSPTRNAPAECSRMLPPAVPTAAFSTTLRTQHFERLPRLLAPQQREAVLSRTLLRSHRSPGRTVAYPWPPSPLPWTGNRSSWTAPSRTSCPPKTPRGFPRRAPKGCRPPAAWPARPGG